jgi:PAS domain S-box-containing protein
MNRLFAYLTRGGERARQNEQRLRESDERFTQLADNITDAFWIRSADFTNVDYVSPAFERIWGRPVAELYAKPQAWSLYIHPDDRADVIDAFETLKGDSPSLDLEYRILRPDGEIRWVRSRGFRILDAAGVLIRHTGIVTDITERRHAAESLRTHAEALRASLEEFRTLAEAVPQIVWITRSDGYNIFFNQRWTDYTGLTPAQSRGSGWITPFHPEDRERARTAWDVAIATHAIYSAESRLRRVDGAYRWWLIRGAPLRDADGAILKWFGTCTDIHDLKMAQIENVRVNRALKMLSSCNEMLVRTKDEGTLIEQICAIAVEHGGYRMAWVGYAQDDAPRSIWPLAHAGEEHGYLSTLRVTWNADDITGQGPAGECIRTGQPVVCEDITLDAAFAPWLALAQQRGFRAVTCLPLRDATRTFGVLTLYSAGVNEASSEELQLLQDLADDVAFGIGNLRLQAEQQRLDAKVREQAALLDNANDAIYARNLAGQITYWNKGAERAYGHLAAEVLGRKAVDVLCRDPNDYLRAEAQLVIDGVWEGETARRTKSDRDITMAVRWTLGRDAHGKPQSILAIDTDITEKKALEAQFLRAQRMESIGTLAGGLAHDLNNVLAPIVMSIDMLKALVPTADGLALLSTLQGSAQRGATLVKQVLSFARGVDGQRIAVNPLLVMRDLLEVIRDTFPKSVDVRCLPALDLWTVTGDPTQMHQIFLNLCVNARDAMPAGGTITIRMNNVVFNTSHARMHPDAHPGHYVCIEVEDTGTGIPANLHNRVFEPFFTTKETGKGTGLGLSTTLAIVKSHGGFIDLCSAVGRGTTFSAYLPANAAVVSVEAVSAEATGLPQGRDQLILVVDDEEAIRVIAQRTLEAAGYRVMVACDGAEALALYATHHTNIALVLTDMSMPVMDGAALIARLEAMNPQVRIIRSSGLLSAVDANGGSDAAQHFIPKPYTAAVMLRTMREALSA